MNKLFKISLTAITVFSLNSYAAKKAAIVASHCDGSEITAENPALPEELLCNKENGIPILNKELNRAVGKLAKVMSKIIISRELTYINYLSATKTESGASLRDAKQCSQVIKSSLSKCDQANSGEQMTCIYEGTIAASECVDNVLTEKAGIDAAQAASERKLDCDKLHMLKLAVDAEGNANAAKNIGKINKTAISIYEKCLNASDEEKIALIAEILISQLPKAEPAAIATGSDK